MITFKTQDVVVGGHPATLVDFLINDGGVIEPSQLSEITPPEVDGRKGVIISGRGPVWLYAFLVHHWHIVRWCATYDPRLGAVVVASHHPESPPVSSILQLPKE